MATQPISRTDWDFVKKLGSGSFGDVTLWHNPKTGQSVAIKRCSVALNRLDLDEKTKLQNRWHSELEFMQYLDSPHIVGVCPHLCLDLIEEQNRTCQLPVIVMEYCDGGNLRHKLHQIDNVNGLSEHDVRQILDSVAKAIFYLHNRKNLTHRDIKPDNIVIKISSDGTPIYKLTDMGYARHIDRNTIAGSMVGSANYFAPEIVLSAEYKNSVDYWSMAIVAFELITGRYPFLQDHSICEVMTAITNKPADCIAITKTIKTKELHYHEHLFAENRLSVAFCHLIESWLQLALNKDGRLRGYEGGKLMFYDKLNQALNTKIFIVYWINKCKFLSYCVDSTTTMDSLYSAMESDTSVNKEKFYFILPTGHTVNSMSLEVQPIDLYDAKFAADEKPMLYLVDFEEEKLCVPEENISDLIREMFNSNDRLQPWALKIYMFNLLYLHCNERRRIGTFFNGLLEYALNLENEIMRQKQRVIDFQQAVVHYNGEATQFETTIREGKQLLAGKNLAGDEFVEWETMTLDFKNVCGKYHNIYLPYKEVLKKIRQLITELEEKQSPLAMSKTKFELLVEDFENLFQAVRDNNSSPKPISDTELRAYTSRLLLARHAFFENVNKWLKKTTSIDSIMAIHKEFREIIRIVLESFQLLKEASEKFQEKTRGYLVKFSELHNTMPKAGGDLIEMMDTLHLDNGQMAPSLSHSMEESFLEVPTSDLINDSRRCAEALSSFWRT